MLCAPHTATCWGLSGYCAASSISGLSNGWRIPEGKVQGQHSYLYCLTLLLK